MKKSLTVAGILIVAGLAIALCALMQCNFDWNLFSTEQTHTEEIRINETIHSIIVDGTSCDVQFLPGESCIIKYRGGKPSAVENSVDNGKLTIHCRERAECKKWYEQIAVVTVSPKITVCLPADSPYALAVSLESGTISLDKGLQLSGTTLSTASGDILITDVSCKSLLAKTESGKILLDTISCEKADLQSHSGDVSLQSLLAEQLISVKTSSGEVSLSRCDSHHIEVQTSSGDVFGSFLSPKCFVTASSSGEVHVPKTQAEEQCLIFTDSGDIDFS